MGAARRLARRGLRVLAVAERAVEAGATLDGGPRHGVTFLGFLAYSDPIRATAAEAVRKPRRAGVDIMMMTGDHLNTAESIASELDLINGERSTPATREAADLLVTDNRIETIVEALLEGRALWASTREAAAILVGGNLGEIAFTVAGAAAMVPATGLGSAALLAGVVQTPGRSHFFGCRPLGPLGWTISAAASGGASAGSLLIPRILSRALPPTREAGRPMRRRPVE